MIRTPKEHAIAAAIEWSGPDVDITGRLVELIERACLAVEQDTAARVTLEMAPLVCKAEQDERARIARLWEDVMPWHVIAPESIAGLDEPTLQIGGVTTSAIRALCAALAPDPVQVRAPDAPLSVAPLWCPWCGLRHVDEGEFATRPHHTHRCVAVGGCGREWRLETYVAGAPVAGQCDWFGEEPAKAPALETADDALERAARMFESDAANDEEKASQVVALRSESSEGTAATLLYCARQSRLSAARVRSLKGAP